MGTEYSLYCKKHGRIHIEIEKPPDILKDVYCPGCRKRLMQPGEGTQKNWQPNLVSEGAQA